MLSLKASDINKLKLNEEPESTSGIILFKPKRNYDSWVRDSVVERNAAGLTFCIKEPTNVNEVTE